ncbi:MAG: helix-turn-helix domain-containing protein [Kiloniellales bacterium]
MTDAELSPTDRNVAFVLQAHAGNAERKAWPSIKTLKRLTGIGERTLQASLKRLVAAGWFSVESGGQKLGRPNVYQLRFDGRFEDLSSFENRRKKARQGPQKLPTHPPQDLRTPPADIADPPPQKLRIPPAESADETLKLNPQGKPLRETSGGGTQRRGTRIPDDWQPTEDGKQILLGKGYEPAEIEAEAENFRDHWLGESGRKGVKRDWPATWRKWCRSDYCRPKRKRGMSNGDGFLSALKGAVPSDTPCGTVIDVDFQQVREAGR